MEQALYPAIDRSFSMRALKIYYERLKAHDWFFGFSDSRKVRNEGARAERALRAVAEELGKEYGDLFDKFDIYRHNKIKGIEAQMPEEPK